MRGPVQCWTVNHDLSQDILIMISVDLLGGMKAVVCKNRQLLGLLLLPGPASSMVVFFCTSSLISSSIFFLSHCLIVIIGGRTRRAGSEAYPRTSARMTGVMAQLLAILVSLLFLLLYIFNFSSCLRSCIWLWGPMSRWTPAARMFQKKARVWPSDWTLFFESCLSESEFIEH